MKNNFLLTSLFLILATPSVAFCEIYKWVDENGKTQITDDVRKVPKSKAESAKQKLGNEGFSSPQTAEQKIKYIQDEEKARQKEIDANYGPTEELSKEDQIAKIRAKKRIAEEARRELQVLQFENMVKQEKNKENIEKLEKDRAENKRKLEEIIMLRKAGERVRRDFAQ